MIKIVYLYGNGLIGRADVTWTADTCYDEFGNPFTCYNRQDERFYYIKDHLGSIRVTVNQTGEVVGAQDYYPFGEVLRGLEPPVSSNEKYKFTEKERDKETTYDYFGARYYDSELGRWLSVDPLSSKYPGFSPYVYTANNPLKFIDPNGMSYRDLANFPGEVHARNKNNSRKSEEEKDEEENEDKNKDFRKKN
jgi:RHS repeat-associated protein